MKKKAKRYQSGGVLRDRFGNPVRSGSGEVVRTGFPDREYDEQASASMTESSDYSGRRARSPERTTESSMTSDYMPSRKPVDIGFGGAEEEESRKITDYIRSSPKEDSVTETVKEEVKPKPKAKPKPRKRVSQSFGETDSDALNKRRLEGLSKSDSPYGKSERLKALMGTFSPERSTKRYAESTPYARSKMGMKSGGKVSSASKRADGIAQKGKTRGRIC
jgi:hypothetical protein